MSEKSDLRRLLGYVATQRRRIAVATLASVLSAGCFSLAMSLVKWLAAALGPAATAVKPATGSSAAKVPLAESVAALKLWLASITQPCRDWLLAAPVLRVSAAILLLYLFKGVMDFVAEYGMQRAGIETVNRMRRQIYERLIRQSDSFFRRRSAGDLMSRTTGDTGRLQRILGSDIGQLVQSIPIAVVMLLFALINTWQVTVVALVLIPIFVFTAGRLGRKIKRSAKRAQESAGRLTAVLEETLLARRVVQAFSGEEHEAKRFAATLGQIQREELKTARASSLTPPAMELLAAATFVLVLTLAVGLQSSGLVDWSDVIVSFAALAVVFVHVRRLGRLSSAMQQALAAARRVFEVIDEPMEIVDREGARTLLKFENTIRFERVAYSYGRGAALDGIDLELRRGEVHALVGPSGAGKTTLAMLLPRFFDPTEGRVVIDDHDLREVRLGDLRRMVALVTQETHLFDASAFENIAYANAAASEKEIIEASIAAHADEFLATLPKGYRTPLGERGSALSAGQRQRVAIARAFLKDAPILILDEATSALDSESEQKIQMALERLMKGRTGLIIAHRLSTVRRADKIHVLVRGRVVESGRHEELVEFGGHYARLLRLQKGDDDDLDTLAAMAESV